MTIEYAMYRGDEFIDIGTIDELADKYYKKRELLAYLSKESTHEKMKNDDTQLLLYKIGNKKGETKEWEDLTLIIMTKEIWLQGMNLMLRD